MRASVQERAEVKVNAVLRVQQDTERLMESVRRMLAADSQLYEAMEAAEKGRRSA